MSKTQKVPFASGCNYNLDPERHCERLASLEVRLWRRVGLETPVARVTMARHQPLNRKHEKNQLYYFSRKLDLTSLNSIGGKCYHTVIGVRVIRKLSIADQDAIYDIINRAACAYQGAIPDDCYHQPYMPREELQREMKRITFVGWEEGGKILGVMGLEPVKDVTLIRHAYVLPEHQRQGMGTKLLAHLKQITRTRRLLVGTWAANSWGIAFYRKHGFKLLPDKDDLLKKYWDISQRQIETSVVLGIEL